MPNETVWIAFGDIHEDMTHLSSLPFAICQGIIITGDMTNCGGVATAKHMLNSIAARCFLSENIEEDGAAPPQIFAQIGNMDLPEVDSWLSELGWNIHAKVVQVAHDAVMVGLGGSNKTPFTTPSEFTEAEYEAILNTAKHHIETLGAKHVLLVSHTPPMNTACDCIGGGVHVGSTAVRDFIETVQPELCLCGHIHEATGTDSIGRTTIINAGAFAAGGYVRVCLDEAGFSGELRGV